jgi:hypothetical protein
MIDKAFFVDALVGFAFISGSTTGVISGFASFFVEVFFLTTFTISSSGTLLIAAFLVANVLKFRQQI